MPPIDQPPFSPLEPTPKPVWRRGLERLTRPVVWIPLGFALAGGAVGAYYLLTNSSASVDSSDQSTLATKPPSQDDSSTEADDAEVEDKKKSDKKDKKTDKKPDSKPKPKPGPVVTPPASPSPTPTPPRGLVKPNASNTGPRYSLTRTLTPDQALAELRNKGKLSRVKISGSLRLAGSDGRNWVIEDSVIVTTRNYGIQAYNSIGSFTGSKAERPIFRYVEIIGRAAASGGRCSAVVYGSDIVLQHADLYGCDDGIKASHRVDVISSWLHDNDHPSGAHCDAIQIRSGTDILIRGSRLDAYVGYSSDGSQVPSGSTCSGGLQTGSVSGPISARWENNWFAGGHYTIRGSSDARVNYVFRGNKWMSHGTSVALGLSNLQPNRFGPITGGLGDFDSSNVWEDTGQPVR